MAKLDSNAAWKEAMALVAANREVLFAIAGVFFLLPSLLLAVFVGEPQVDPGADSDQMMAAMMAFYTESWWLVLAATLIEVGGMLAVLALMRDRSRPTVGEAIRGGFTGIPTYVAAQFLFAFALALVGGVAIGAAAAVLPVLAAVLTLLLMVLLVFTAIRLILVAPVVAVEATRNPIAALRRSWSMTRGNFWRIFVFLALVAVLFFVALAVIMILVGIVLALVSEGGLQRVLASVVSSALTALAVLYFMAILAAIHRQLGGQERSPWQSRAGEAGEGQSFQPQNSCTGSTFHSSNPRSMRVKCRAM